MASEPRPIYLQGAGTPVFGMLHRGAPPVHATAVLLCPPHGWEDMCSYRVRREWAEQLALAGHTVLRIDLAGSGDSAGTPHDAGRVEDWTEGLAAAAAWLRGESAADRVAAVGIGLGGLIACRAALAGAALDELALWSVPAEGRRLLRELRTFAAVETARAAGGRTPVAAEGDQEPDDGRLVANGYLMSAETVRALEAVDLRVAPAHPPHTSRALLLGRDGLRADRRLEQALAAAGAEVSTADGPGYAAMMVEPQDARTPVEVFALVQTWLREAPQPRVQPAPQTAEPASTRPARAREQLELTHLGVAIRERPLLLDGPSARLFGVLTEPLEGRRELTALLLNAGPQRRTGPNRMWVEIARRWAAIGVSTLRLDAAGIGDSDGDGSVLAREAEFYRPGYVAQTRAAIEMLAGRGLPQRFVLLGLCGGAYWSAHAALADERVRAVMLLNPRTLIFDEWAHTRRRMRELRERALLGSTWRKAINGELRLARHLETGRTLVEHAARAPSRARRRILAPDAQHQSGSDMRARSGAVRSVEAMFDALRDRGQNALVLFSGEEVLRRDLAQRGVLGELARWPNLELAVRGTTGDTHTLRPPWLQRETHALLDAALDRELKRL